MTGLPSPYWGHQDRLLKALAEELKAPLLQIARQAELVAMSGGQSVEDARRIETTASQALWFVDSYVLSQQLQEQTQLALEPVAIPAILHETALLLEPLADQFDCTITLRISGRLRPVLAHRQGLQTALLALGSTFITMSQPGVDNHVVLAAHTNREGIVAGVFSAADGLSQAVYRRGQQLYGRARQPLQSATAGSGAAFYVADSLLGVMNSRLRVTQYQKLNGLAATLQPSHQLRLI